ncbi:MAG: c-type cytochrome [Armatimonadetes bacterium]|nr:c-type cytochrome [Armatimonadota bacterium]
MKRPLFASAFALSAVAAVIVVSPAFATQEAAKKPVTFAEVGPVLKKNCAGCHTGDYAKAGIKLDSLKNIMESKAVVAGKPEKSKIYLAASGAKGVKRMPPGPKALDEKTVAMLKTWIEQGAK